MSIGIAANGEKPLAAGTALRKSGMRMLNQQDCTDSERTGCARPGEPKKNQRTKNQNLIELDGTPTKRISAPMRPLAVSLAKPHARRQPRKTSVSFDNSADPTPECFQWANDDILNVGAHSDSPIDFH